MKFEAFEKIFNDSTSNYTKIKKEDYKPVGKYPIIDQGQSFIGGYTDDSNLIVTENVPVIIFGDHTKVFKYINFPFTIGADGVKVLTLKNKNYNSRFYYFFLKSLKIIDKGYSRHFKYLKEKKLPVPENISEQIQVANILSKAETLIEQRKQSIALLDEFLKSTFLEMFGDQSLNPKNFPKGKIRDVVTEVKYGTSSAAEDEGKYPYLRMNNITSEGYWDFSKLKYINVNNEEKEKYVVRKGDLLFNRTNSKELVGKTGVFNKNSEMIIAGYLIRVRTNEKANPWYLWGYLNSVHGKQTLFGMCKSIVGMANINAQELQGIKILIPPIELQTQFANIVIKTETLKEQYKNSLQELENLYGSLSQRAFKGELTITNEESLLMAAEPEAPYFKTSFIPENKKGFAKQVLGGKIVSLFNDDKNFTHIKFQKLQYLAEHIAEEDLLWNYYRQSAGPYDNKFMHTVAYKLKQNKWFEERNYKFYPLEKVDDIEKHYQNYFSSNNEKLNNLFSLLKNASEKLCEAIATIYAVWNNHLIQKQSFDKEKIKRDFFDWSKRKDDKFTEDEFDKALQWMQKHDIVPTGFGQLIKEKK